MTADQTKVTLFESVGLLKGDGADATDNQNIFVEGDRIVHVGAGMPTSLKPDRIIDGTGSWAAPGLVNSHTHGVVLGAPLFSSGAKALPHRTVLANLSRHLSQGTTTVLSLDGFASSRQVLETDRSTPLNVRTGWTHYSEAVASAGALDGTGLNVAASDSFRGPGDSAAVGEGGSGATLGGGVTDYKYLPEAIESEVQVTVSETEARLLKEAVLGRQIHPPDFDPEETERVLRQIGLATRSAAWAKDLIERSVLPGFELAVAAIEAGAKIASRELLPFVVHTAKPSAAILTELDLGPLLVAGHANHPSLEQGEALKLARYLKSEEARVDISTFDTLEGHGRDRELGVFFRFLEEGLADTVSTDYGGGNHSALLSVLKLAVDAGAVTLAKAVSMVTHGPASIFPMLAPERGLLEPGFVADLVLIDRDDISNVRAVMVSGDFVYGDLESLLA
ncbi:MAG: amidohydrolase family protein [Terriglobia bacterium]